MLSKKKKNLVENVLPICHFCMQDIFYFIETYVTNDELIKMSKKKTMN
jgi:hypothetical protein